MIANYGFEDGSGTYYITIDTNKCSVCKERGCIDACPAKLFQVEADDWDEEVVVVKKEMSNKLKSSCTECKPTHHTPELLLCKKACTLQAITHSW